MKKQFSWIVLFIAISLISCIFGCKEPEIETDTKAPANVTKLTVTAADGNAVLTWKNPTDADFDGVQVSMSPAEGTLLNPVILGKNVTSLNVGGLTSGKEYTFTVKTIDTSNNKSSGVSAKATVADYTAPAEVIELTAIVSNENAVLTWKNPSDTDLAGIQISMNPATGTLANTISLGKDVTSLNVSGLDSGVDYTFTVKTFDTSLNYSSGATVKATAVDNFDKTAPAKVTGLTVTAADGDAVLTWKNPSDTDFAGVQISMSPAAGTLANTVSLGKDVTSLNISGIENGKEYTFTVKSFDTSLNYSEGATVTATVADTSDYVAPANVTSLTVTTADGDAVLTWKNPSDTDFAGVQISMSPATGTLANAIILGKDVTSLNINGIENGNEYTFTVKTFDTSLNYSSGATVKATAVDNSDKTAPAKVTSLTVTAADGDAVLTWKNPSDTDFAGVQISMSPAAGTLANTVSLGKDVTSLNISGIENGVEYTFTVKTFDTNLNYSEGTTVTATVADLSDYVAPAKVTSLTVTAADEKAVLTWKNPSDTDFAGVQISMSPAAGTLANTVSLGNDVTSLNISGIENGVEYTFTVKTFDTSLNYSEGATVTATATDSSDKTAPANVTNLTAVNKDASVLLTWEDATDKDVFGYEISWDKTEPINRSLAMESDTMMVAPGAKGCIISNLTNGIKYAFTVKSIDTSGNKSKGVTVMITPSIIEKSPLAITLTPNTTEKTKDDVVVKVNVEIDSASEIKKIAYKEGTIVDIATVLNGTDITETKEIIAVANTTYTVAIADTAGRRELAFISIENIDKTAPNVVDGVVSTYSRETKKITLTWTNPIDDDFAGAVITYGKTESREVTTITCKKTETSTTIENIEPDNSEYTIIIKAKDDIGNLSAAQTAIVIAKGVTGANSFSVGDILFTDGTRIKAEDVKYGVPDSQIDKAFAVIVSIDSFDGATGKAIGLKKGSGRWAPEGSTGYKTNFMGIQSDYSISSSGEYIFTEDLDGSDNWDYICSIDPEGTANAATNYPIFNFANTYGTTAGLTGTDYENGWYVPSIAELYNVFINKKVVQTSLHTVDGFTISTNYYSSSSQHFSNYNNAYRVYFGSGTVDDTGKNSSLNVFVLQAFNAEQFNNYEVTTTPRITNVSIPTVGEGYTGELPVTIIGENLKGHAITSDEASFTNVKTISNTKATATITYDGTVSDITVTCARSSANATIEVVTTDKCYEVGDIILKDGSKVSVNDVKSSNSSPIGVIASVLYGGGVGKAIGLQKSSTSVKWAPDGSTGYKTNFVGIQAEVSGSISSGYTFAGDLDGSDNWEYVRSVDPEGCGYASTNYPVFNYANNYVRTGTIYGKGWYVPSIAELYDVYLNREVVQISLTAAGGFDLGTSYYWSSSQNPSYDDSVYQVYFSNGSVSRFLKTETDYVFVLQALTAK